MLYAEICPKVRRHNARPEGFEENKLKMFRWKLFHFIIPNKVLLFKWKIVGNSLCNFCKLDEDYSHYFITCTNVPF